MDQANQSTAADQALPPRPGLQARPIRRRNRMINSCLECRKRKLKCTKTSPTCTNCIKAGRDCLYIGPRLDEASQMRLAEIKEKQGTLERQLERDIAKSTTSKNTLQQRILADEVEDDFDEERDLEATPLVALDLTYEDDADGADDMIDLGIQIGKMRITERIGGLSRPRISEELSAGISRQSTPVQQPPQRGGPMPVYEDLGDGMSDTSIPDFLKPGNQYIVPTSGFLFGQIGEPPSILQFLPFRAAADRLMTQYFISVHTIAPCSHRPSLEMTYATFWEEITAGIEPRPSVQAIIFAAMFSGVVSMEEDVIYHELGYSKGNWVTSLRMGTETALSKANFLRTTKVETMQAFVVYMLPLCRAEVSRAHSVLVAAAVRMAECMGLHRDGEAYGLTPLETHVRRLVWHQLCFLDIRTCEAQGPKPVIRRDDYDTKLPLNCDEDELTHAIVPPESSDCWTTNTLALIRFEINEMMRIIWLDRRRLESRRTTLTAVLTKIENFRRRMSEKYDHLLDVAQPIQRYAKCVMYLLTYRLHVMVLHPYHSNATNPMPPRLNHLLITSGIMVVELAIQLETNPLFHEWAWYLGAYFQYQIALLLATEVYFRPQSREADRIWSCLDYVFGMDRKLPPEAKGIQLLSEIQSRTAVYMRMRKMRGPSSTARAMPGQYAVGGIVSSSPSAGPSQPPQPPALGMMAGAPKIEPGYNTPPMHHGVYMPQPQPQMVFAGVSDGQALWSLPPTHHESPGGSDSSSVAIGQQSGAPGMSGAGLPQDNIMDNIDWDTINTLFPNDPQTGGLSIQGFHDQNFGILNWSGQP
ncbi:Uu.00g045130.m01.CDS01 [Anthostomella pinea]|uniref:Uu.00g045130.m01.CDS01 n=1 Tax=Anthostomella pinea TaxID=933095 RepID=A0AAI8YED0_9PEZI|nr:Uu.00g045130.m01.CDS01 [Anthostomella pinea]